MVIKKDDVIPLYVYKTNDNIEKCVKTYTKQYQYRKYKADLNMLKNLMKKLI